MFNSTRVPAQESLISSFHLNDHSLDINQQPCYNFIPLIKYNFTKLVRIQRAKKVVSDSPGLVDFAFGLVNSVLNLSDRQVNFLGKFKLQKDGNQSC